MRRFATVVVLLMAVASMGLAQSQLSVIGEVNGYVLKNNPSLPDSMKPYSDDQGVRTVWVTKDLDKDGKPEIVTTDYSNGGRVHVFEYTSGDTLELVWSSPVTQNAASTNSVPRWIQDGDLDGDGNRELIFPHGDRYTGEIEVFEWTGADNDYGTEPALTLPASLFTSSGLGRVRMDRETGTVADFDGDGLDELITANEDNKVYIFGVAGDLPGFAQWQIEGGDPTVVTENRFSPGSWWHSVFVDINGDGKKEIVNEYWNHYGFWSIIPLGPDTYRYPKPKADSATVPAAKYAYHEYLADAGEDATAYMGVQPVDVDGDGKQEIAGILYIGNDPYTKWDYSVSLVSLAKSDTGVYVWRDSSQFSLIGTKLWELAGATTGSHWGIAAYDFNGNGKQEVLVGGSAGYNVTALEYKGTGSILDEANYNKTIYYPGDPARYHEITYTLDTLGHTDTTYAESPFLSKMWAGCDLNNNGKKEIVISYQSIADSITYFYKRWDKTQVPVVIVTDSTVKRLNTNVISIRLLEYEGPTGISTHDLVTVTPDDYVLDQNYPNPFNPSTTIRISLPLDKKISLVVYDMLGREVKTLIANETYKRGSHQITWNGTDNRNHPVASGGYVYTLKYGNFSKSAKMTLLK